MIKLKGVVMCEESQAVTKAFRELGHEVYSNDTKPCSGGHPEWHIQNSALDIMNDGWDFMIGHPPCTYLSYAGIRHWNAPGRLEKRLEALEFFGKLWTAPIKHICLENPKGCASPTIAKYSQEIQPYYFGDAGEINNKPNNFYEKRIQKRIHGAKLRMLFGRTVGKSLIHEQVRNRHYGYFKL